MEEALQKLQIRVTPWLTALNMPLMDCNVPQVTISLSAIIFSKVIQCTAALPAVDEALP